VKISENDKTQTNLETQLRGYLTDQSYKHDIFLVEWHFEQFGCKPTARPVSAVGLTKPTGNGASLNS
jgi:DNA/RNA-binding domain of Phe-tRNA-synthetase-like protein